MADIVVDGKTRVDFVPTIATPDAPSVSELTAGTRLDLTLVPTGLEGFEPSPAEVDTSSLGGKFDTKRPGTSSFSGTRLVLKKQDGTDDIFDTLTVATDGYIVIRDGVDNDTAYAAADEVQVYPVATSSDGWGYMQREKNATLKYWVATPVSDQPELKATVSA